MLDENLPTYRASPSTDNPLNTVLYFTHNGSEPAPYYVLKRPTPSSARNQYALGLMDIQYASVVYGEVLVKPDWTQPTLSAAEVRANGGNPVSVPVTPKDFSVSLYNPDQTVTVKYNTGSWSKDSWEFEIPERTFKMPSSSQIDAQAPAAGEDFAPKVMFRWKRDGRVNRDMTCYMTGRNLGNKKNKEPDITVALYKATKNDGAVAIYEPNMARVDVEDRKGLEVALLLSAEVIRDFYLVPRQNLFNADGSAPATGAGANSSSGTPLGGKPVRAPTQPLSGGPAMSGALSNEAPSSKQPGAGPPPNNRRGSEEMRKAKEAESRRLQALVQEEKNKARERERRDREEQQRIKEMLEQEERERKRIEAEEIERETERLRKEYGVQGEPSSSASGRTPSSPPLPPRPSRGGGWFGRPSTRPSDNSQNPPQPPRPTSTTPATQPTSSSHQQANGEGVANGARKKLGQFLNASPYSGPAGASASAFFGSGAKSDDEREKRKKAKKKKSVHF